MATGVYWTLHTSTDEYILNGLSGEWPQSIIGEETTIRLWINDDGSLTVGSGDTYTVESDTAEFYETVAVDGTLNVDGELVVGAEGTRWTDVEAYTDYAGQVATGRDVNNTPWFVEQLPSGSRIGSIVLGFEPGPALQARGVEGVWGVLVGGQDLRNSPISNHQLELDVNVLDRFSEYADVSAVKSDLEA